MGALRDFFAAVGFCESTADLARKPELIAKIAGYSMAYADPQSQYGAKYPYKDRLELALSQASSYALSRLIEENVIVCMDQRLARLDLGFWDSNVYSAFYDDGKNKVLSLYDNGKSYEETGFFETGIVDHSEDAISHLVDDVLNEAARPGMLLGTTHSYYNAATKTMQTYFEWHDPEDFESELEKNPELKTPPLRTGSINAPVLAMNG